MEQSKKNRPFRPRKIIPKQRLIDYLEEGYTLEEIGKEKVIKVNTIFVKLCKKHRVYYK